LRTTARITAFRPGQSPPPVNIPIRISNPLDLENSQSTESYLTRTRLPVPYVTLLAPAVTRTAKYGAEEIQLKSEESDGACPDAPMEGMAALFDMPCIGAPLEGRQQFAEELPSAQIF
jgi:hypothetical protein